MKMLIVKEDEKNIYLAEYTIPKGAEKEDLKAREIVIWAMLGKWISQNPLKRKKNIDLQDFIYLRFDGMQETVNKAARNFKSTMAIYSLDYILENAIQSGTDIPKSKRQSKFAKMLIMHANTNEYIPYFEKIKMLVGLTKQKKDARKIQYSITAIEPA
ncbi:hypothetical protein AGMMS4956_15960 [Bacteroidia bacterium]|nr:hypothetical protein AGMMS4956_15960 [Bacteroidia bacterium]